MHLQQTKKGSRGTGGPQYYFHNLTDSVKSYLRHKGAVRVALVTPYGATKSDYFAVSKEHKFDKDQNVVEGKVDHDRIQQGRAGESIGEAVRKWYSLKKGDFDRLDVDVDIIDDVFYITPLTYKYSTSSKVYEISKIERPLTFTKDYISPLWKNQISSLKDEYVKWSLAEICRIVGEHKSGIPYIKEEDILRASGPLKYLGVTLGPYVGKGYDCYSQFKFLHYPPYAIPVEIKKYSSKFKYQEQKYGKEELSRAVILCTTHDKKNVHKNIDVIELESLCDYRNYL